MNISDQKIITGIKYFVKNTRHVGRTKLFKLLYFWDFMYFKKHGLSVTCLDYVAYPFGPVPQQLWDWIKTDTLPEAYRQAFSFVEAKEGDNDEFTTFKIILRDKKIDFEWLSPHERETLEQVTYIFKDSTAREMTEISHLHHSPWDLTKNKLGMYKQIDYSLAIDDESTLDPETIKEFHTIQRELNLHGGICPGADIS